MMFLSLILSCATKVPALEEPEQPVQARQYHEKPGPLEARAFQIPELQKGELSNGLPVSVSTNNEVPLVYVWMTFDAGGWTDPEGMEGLSSVTMDMLDEGAGPFSAQQLSAEKRKLAASISTGAGLDSSSITLKSLKRNLGESLALMSTVLTQPTFPAEEWEKLRKKRLQNLKADREDPKSISSKIWKGLMYGEQYAGRKATEESYAAISRDEILQWYGDRIRTGNARIWVGGAVTLEEIMPMLEEQFAGWTQEGEAPPLPSKPDKTSLRSPDSTTIYLYDKPGSSQSVLKMGLFVGERTDEDNAALTLANQSIGGMFTARINMNLREDKGWTYGAWSWMEYNYLPGLWAAGANVVTEHTADSIGEIVRELRESKESRQITQTELDAGRGYLMGTWPLRFEQPTYLLQKTAEIQRYDLPENWLSSYRERMQEVPLDKAQEAWNQRIDPDSMTIVIVGDRQAVEQNLLQLGYPVIVVDSDGNQIED
jgi:zinc protease